MVEHILGIILNRAGSIEKFLARHQSFIISLLGFYNDSSLQVVKDDKDFEYSNKILGSSEEREDGLPHRGDMEAVMARLGFFCPHEGDKLEDELDSKDLLNLFEEKEPSLDEVKQAFDIFDQNKDGFIDAAELQRVLYVLGMKEGLEMRNCMRMIAAFDENRDGRIDFGEFVKLMEKTFC
ncbi:hypothetical protein NMG60_11006435 [Bertholletia excelsa]